MTTEPATIWTTHEDLKPRQIATRTSTNGSATASSHDAIKSSYLVGVDSRFRRKYYSKVTHHRKFYAVFALLIILLVIAVIVIACRLAALDEICHSDECLRTSSTFLDNMDLTANPCEDFFQFTCGNFENEHPRPDSQTSHDWFTEKQAKTLREIRKKLHFPKESDLKKEPVPVTKARMLYFSCLDSATTDKMQFDGLFHFLKEFSLPKVPTIIADPDSLDFQFDWIKSIAKIKRSLGADKLIGFEIFPDPKNRSENFLAIGSPSTENELPLVNDILAKRLKRVRRRSWSLTKSEKETEEDLNDVEVALVAYAVYMKEVLSAIMKAADPTIDIDGHLKTIAQAIEVTIDISKQIYSFIEVAENASKAEDANGNLPDLVYVKISELQKLVDDDLSPTVYPPVFEQYLKQMLNGIPEAQFEPETDVLLTSNADILYLKLAIKLVAETSPKHLEMFIWWSVIEDLILYTTTNMRQLYYEYSKTLTGVDGAQSRSSYCTASVNKLMGFAVSFLIIEDDFMTATKPKVEKMVENIRRAFNNLVYHATWMDWETKASTLKKSQKMKSLIGFPEWIVNKTLLETHYKGLKIKNDAWMENIVQLLSWEFMDKLSNWRMKNEFSWATSPTNVNAFHTFQANAITIPLAILQFPFYQLGLEALNYGSIGSILAHEITHGFDDVGRHFDENGNKNFWWTDSTIGKFVNRTECFKKQYSEYYLPEINDYINGELTLGENIADNGGLREAYFAYNYYVQSTGREPKLPGFEKYTHEQLFFMSFGNLWCETMTPTGLRFSLEDTHCPGKIRMLGVLSNFREFHDAFKCHPGQHYHRTDDQKCIIW